tara:strand:+ start:7036 stop:7296 length:261 start_codon:yes stop_codon:yes gene_type:complete
MDSVREQIEEALQRSKIHKETVYGILRQIADAIEPPAPAPVKVAAPAPVKAPAPAPPAPAPPAPAPAPATPKKKVVKRVVKKKVAE